MVISSRKAEACEQVRAELENESLEVLAKACNVSRKEELQALVDATLAKWGRIDIVINGAGVNSPTPFLDISEEELERIVNVNFKGVFLGCQVFGRHLVERGQGGSIINLGSIDAKLRGPPLAELIL